MRFKMDEIPQQQYDMLGISKMEFLSLPTRTLEALLSGNRTSLIRFNSVRLGNDRVTLDARLSLERNERGEVFFRIHSPAIQTKNHYNLTDTEVQHLRERETNFVARKTVNKEGEKKNLLISMDPLTGEQIGINKASIRPPEAVNGIKLSSEQKAQFQEGKPIQVGDQQIQFNPHTELGFSPVPTNYSLDAVKSAKFQYGSYTQNHLMFDLALLASGAAGLVMIEHLARLTLSYVKYKKDINELLKEPGYKRAIDDIATELKGKKEMMQKEPAKVGALISKHLQASNIEHTNKQVQGLKLASPESGPPMQMNRRS